MSKIDIAALITALGGRESLQHLLGVGPSAVSNYLTKGALPNRARPLIRRACASPPCLQSNRDGHRPASGKVPQYC
ncbi:MAG: hypothetical protein ACPG48_02630 [Candidatus Puniceispirillaceae bacterium]